MLKRLIDYLFSFLKKVKVAKKTQMNRYLYILDNGHGFDTPGKRSPKVDGDTLMYEYEYNRDIVERIDFMCMTYGIKTHRLVPGIHDKSLKNRVLMSNQLRSQLPKIFISVHGNAGGNKLKNGWYSGNGISTYSYRGAAGSKKVARIFQDELIKEMNPYEDHAVKDRGVKESGFYVLKYTKMPAILTENGFFTNKRECYWMLTNDWRHKIALAHFNAIKRIERSNF